MLAPQQIIQTKRDGRKLSESEIRWFVEGVTSGEIEDSQVAAFAMAVFFRGMSRPERVALTLAMRDSGSTLDWRDLQLDGPVIDKHSTGGVGDTVSIMLGPLLAACGGYVPMISGRGLGHTGGTVDKLESIPGYRTAPELPEFRRVVKQAGVAIVGQTNDVAPADRRMYAIRDVTATVESIDLITASILSKKLAAGLDALVMDVKVGSGAFMKTQDESRQLADSIVQVACDAGVQASALLTDMNQCLANTAGNALEIAEAAAFLRGEIRSRRLADVTFALGSELLANAGLATTPEEAVRALHRALDSGAAAERFDRMVAELGGPSDFTENADKLLPSAPIVKPVFAKSAGVVASLDVRRLGATVAMLGGGRTKAGQEIDPAVGLENALPLGAEADRERPLAIVHARSDGDWNEAAESLRKAYTLGAAQVADPPLIYELIRTTPNHG